MRIIYEPTGFNSRPSCDGRRNARSLVCPQIMFQFTPVLRRATKLAVELGDISSVSIHARLATGDKADYAGMIADQGFNSRPSCDGRLRCLYAMPRCQEFQFTPVLRRATHT